jgi:hypothetical protein
MANGLAARRSTVKPGEKAWTISLDGFASRTGTAQHNEYLSAMREQAVEAYLKTFLEMKPKLAEQVKIDRTFHGFRDTPVSGENARFRCVRVVAHRPGLPPPPIPVPDAGSTRFMIRLLGLVSAGKFGAQHDDAAFEIVDLKNNKLGIFQFIGGGLAIPTPLPPFSATSPGTFKVFNTTRPVELRDFEGEATFGQGPSLGPLSVEAQLSVESKAFRNKGAFTVPHSGIGVPLGATIGGGIFSVTKGILVVHAVGPRR